jgi:hypothetical protein
MRTILKSIFLSFVVVAVLGVVLIYALFFFDIKKSCGTLLVQSFSIRDSSTKIIVNSKDCDDGLYVSESFEVLIEYMDGKGMSRKRLLASSHEFPGSRAPDIKILSPSQLLVVTRKEWVLEQGSEQVDGISIKYDFN